jgi:hypothetical protein
MAASIYTTESFWSELEDIKYKRQFEPSCWKYICNLDVHKTWLKSCEEEKHWNPFEINGKVFEGRSSLVPNSNQLTEIWSWFMDSPEFEDVEVMRLSPGATIPPHIHEEEWLYNMAINHPQGCKFGIHPAGIIPYTPGDVYKINVNKDHCVVNDSSEFRYHVVFKDYHAS